MRAQRAASLGLSRLPFFKDVVARQATIGHKIRAAKRGVRGLPNLLESMSPESVQSFLALLIGFAVAGVISTGYQALTERPASFRLLEQGPHPSTFAAIPFLVFAAPFIIMRNTIRGRRIEERRFEFVMIATIVAGIWSLMSGTVVVMAFEQIARLMA
jgi:O-antigen/teichoic acid export membrane protein